MGFEAYRPVLEQAAAVLPDQVQVLFLADRGFEHGDLMRWLTARNWDWAIRAKSDLLIQLKSGVSSHVAQLLPQSGEAHLSWHHQRGISFLQLGLRELKRRMYLGLAIPPFKPLPPIHPKPASASLKKQAELAARIEFERVQVFVF